MANPATQVADRLDSDSAYAAAPLGAPSEAGMPRGHRAPVGIWLWGDPDEIEDYLELGCVGLVTNTIVLDQLTDAPKSMIAVVERYLELPVDGPLVVEIDGDTADEFMTHAAAFTRLSPRVVLKIPASAKGLRAVSRLKAGPRLDGHHHLLGQPGSGGRARRGGLRGPVHRPDDRLGGGRSEDHR